MKNTSDTDISKTMCDTKGHQSKKSDLKMSGPVYLRRNSFRESHSSSESFNEPHRRTMTSFPEGFEKEHEGALRSSYPIFALSGGGAVLKATLFIGIIHLPRGHGGVQEVPLQRLIV